MKKSLLVLTATLGLTACIAAGKTAVAEQKTINDGVFTEAQVASGKTVYDASCANCHDMRFYRDTLKSWNSQPLNYLWDTLVGTMPADNPGSLMLEEYTDVIAYILSENDFPTGDTTLDHNNGMDQITILAP